MPSNTTAQKLKIRDNDSLLTLNAPPGFRSALGELPGGVKLSDKAKNYNQLHWFVKTKAQMEEELDGILKLLKTDVICWIYYPKGNSKIQTDLTRDKGWEVLLKKDLQWLSLISF